MFSMFFFLTQFLQGVLDYNPLQAGLAFLPMTAVMFSMVQVVPRLTARVGAMPVLLAGPDVRPDRDAVDQPPVATPRRSSPASRCRWSCWARAWAWRSRR